MKVYTHVCWHTSFVDSKSLSEFLGFMKAHLKKDFKYFDYFAGDAGVSLTMRLIA